MKQSTFADIILLLVAFVWGATFVVVQKAIDILPPHSFNGVRFTIASFSLLIVMLFIDRNSMKTLNKKGWVAGIILGFFLFSGYAFQTIGLLYTSASKAGFITGLSVVLVPIFSIVILKIVPKIPTVVGVLLAAFGLYLLTMVENSGFQFGDFLVLFCAIFFALQIIFTGKFALLYQALPLAWIQISVVAVLSLISAFIFEDITYIINPKIIFASDVIIALSITAIFATALAFFAQTYYQKFITPTRVAIIFAMEPVFAALTSYIVLNERLGVSETLGGLMIFIGMILAGVPADTFSFFFRSNRKSQAKYR